MANGFDRRGAIVGACLFILFMLIGGAALALQTISIKINLPPVNSTAPR